MPEYKTGNHKNKNVPEKVVPDTIKRVRHHHSPEHGPVRRLGPNVYSTGLTGDQLHNAGVNNVSNHHQKNPNQQQLDSF